MREELSWLEFFRTGTSSSKAQSCYQIKYMEDTAMTKKRYTSPSMEIYEIHVQQKLLFGSEINGIDTGGLFEQDDNLIETPESIWEDAV